MGIADADTAEESRPTENHVIVQVSCPAPNAAKYGAEAPKLSSAATVKPAAGSRLAALCGNLGLNEEYFCNYEMNRHYERRFEAAGLLISARGPQGEPRAFELPLHRFFMATLFQPQLTTAATGQPHPIIVGYLKAIAERKTASA
jgi:CTP synthase (UTP-ammonia lyase)